MRHISRVKIWNNNCIENYLLILFSFQDTQLEKEEVSLLSYAHLTFIFVLGSCGGDLQAMS